jgi:hypothetical protein
MGLQPLKQQWLILRWHRWLKEGLKLQLLIFLIYSLRFTNWNASVKKTLSLAEHFLIFWQKMPRTLTIPVSLENHGSFHYRMIFRNQYVGGGYAHDCQGRESAEGWLKRSTGSFGMMEWTILHYDCAFMRSIKLHTNKEWILPYINLGNRSKTKHQPGYGRYPKKRM